MTDSIDGQRMQAIINALRVGGAFDNGMMRQDGTAKGNGYFGRLPNTWGGISTELSAESDVDGNRIHYPLIQPNMTGGQLNSLLSGGRPSDELQQSARQHGIERLMQGRSAFAGPNEQQSPPIVPMAFKPMTTKFPGWME